MESRSLQHPAVRILLLGVAVALALLIVRGPSGGDADRRVIVTGADLLHLRAGFLRTWQREPTPAELRGELDSFIRAEVLYREALARGYDRDDPVVRQAMQRKMEYLAEAQAAAEPPQNAEIEAFFTLRSDRYRQPAVFDFAQVYVSTDAHGTATESHAAELLERLRAQDPDPEAVAGWGDAIMLETVYRGETGREIESRFGGEFAAGLSAVEPGAWAGPLQSGYGLHLVKVLQRQDGRVPDWTEVRGRVLADMEYEAAQVGREQMYQEILQSYPVVLDRQVRDLLEASGQ